ncbi:MAG TPA: flavin-dependent oxidoreductase [Acidimicrobiales bacterium]|nr:flavin-dependent oxidoreductase [Acidimicrobiales bacterium]
METKQIIVNGGGIGGLTLALDLHRLGIECHVYEAVGEIKPLGVGISILPHASKILSDLDIVDALLERCLIAAESVFYNRFGQFVYSEPIGAADGVAWPQLSIHRADIYDVLYEKAIERLGQDHIHLGHRLTRFEQDDHGVTAFYDVTDDAGSVNPTEIRGSIMIGADGIHSVVRKQLNPDEGAPLYQGYNMFRGITYAKPYLSGSSMLRIGWYTSGKLTIYPCRQANSEGLQAMNWIAAVESDKHLERDWGRAGKLEDFIDVFADWKFDFLDVPKIFEDADTLLEYPMVDQEPLDRWTDGRVTLLGDAAHPMVPRGSNGAGQAIVDCRKLAETLASTPDWVEALNIYEADRRPKTTAVVFKNRANPPDAVLREVVLRSHDQPFARLEDVITKAELDALTNSYKETAGYSRQILM